MADAGYGEINQHDIVIPLVPQDDDDDNEVIIGDCDHHEV